MIITDKTHQVDCSQCSNRSFKKQSIQDLLRWTGSWKQSSPYYLSKSNDTSNLRCSQVSLWNKIHGQVHVHMHGLILERIKPTLIRAVGFSPQHSVAKQAFPLCWCKFVRFQLLSNEMRWNYWQNIFKEAIKTQNKLFKAFFILLMFRFYFSCGLVWKLCQWICHHKKQNTRASIN